MKEMVQLLNSFSIFFKYYLNLTQYSYNLEAKFKSIMLAPISFQLRYMKESASGFRSFGLNFYYSNNKDNLFLPVFIHLTQTDLT